MLVPAPVVTEVGYLLGREAGAHVVPMFLHGMANGDLVHVELASADYARMADLVERYGDLPLGTTDAAPIAGLQPLRREALNPAGPQGAVLIIRPVQPPSRGQSGVPSDQSGRGGCELALSGATPACSAAGKRRAAAESFCLAASARSMLRALASPTR